MPNEVSPKEWRKARRFIALAVAVWMVTIVTALIVVDPFIRSTADSNCVTTPYADESGEVVGFEFVCTVNTGEKGSHASISW